MRRIRDLAGGLLLLAAAVAGCQTSESYVRPPKPPEEFNAPPTGDARYVGPVEYPAQAMEQDPLSKRAAKENGKTPGPTRGMGGAGGPGGRPGGM